MRRILPLLLIALVAACSKSPKPKAPAAAPPAAAQKPATPPAPPGVPKDFVAKVESAWPAIEAAGKAFETALAEATAAREAGDRDKMDAAIDIAKKQSTYALDTWGALYYSIDDLQPEAVAEATRKHVAAKEKMVNRWMEKAKALAQFSRAK